MYEEHKTHQTCVLINVCDLHLKYGRIFLLHPVKVKIDFIELKVLKVLIFI